MRPIPSGRGVDVWWLRTQDAEPGPAELGWLSPAETARARALAFAPDRRRYLAAHAMLRRVLARYTGTGPGALVFGRAPCPRCAGPSGRPVLAHSGGSAAPCFSLAHSGDAVVIAVAGRPVGVDVERSPRGCVCALADAAHPADAAVLAGTSARERHGAVIGWWVRVEAALKCTGEGIGHGVGGFPALAADDVAHGCSLASLAAPPGYRAALALAGDGGVAAAEARWRV